MQVTSIRPFRISYRHSQRQPAATNATDTGRAENRRVELIKE